MPEYGSGGDLTVIMEGPFSGGGGTAAKIGYFNAPAADWKGATSPYSQIVQVEGVSVNSKLDLQLNVDQMELFLTTCKIMHFVFSKEYICFKS